MPLVSGVNGSALASLSSIDEWISSLNATVSGAAKTGYKTNKITFGGGVTFTDKLPKNGALGIQYAEQSLNVSSTNIDFSEGQVAASTEYTHMAINGSQNAFFLLTDSTSTANNLPAGVNRFYAREGEFHLDSLGYIRSKDGLYLIGQDSLGANSKIKIDLTNDPDPKSTMTQILENHNLNQPPTIAIGAAATAGTDRFSLIHSFVTDLSNMKFSKYGSQVYELNGFPITAPPGVVTDEKSAGAGSKVRISNFALEASNTDLPSTLVELSLAQKIYTALTKVLQIESQKNDAILGLIR